MRTLLSLTLAVGILLSSLSLAEEMAIRKPKTPRDARLDALVAQLTSKDQDIRFKAILELSEAPAEKLKETVKLLLDVNERGIFVTHVRELEDEKVGYAYKPCGCGNWQPDNGYLGNFYGYGYGGYGYGAGLVARDLYRPLEGKEKDLKAKVDAMKSVQDQEIATSIEASEQALVKMQERAVDPLIAIYREFKDEQVLLIAPKVRIFVSQIDEKKGAEQLAARRRLYDFLIEVYTEKAKETF